MIAGNKVKDWLRRPQTVATIKPAATPEKVFNAE